MTPVTEITPGFIRGKLTILRQAEEEQDTFGTNQSFTSKKLTAKKWLCRCECGNEVIAYDKALKKGTMISCGCQHPAPDLSGEKFGRLTVMYRLTDSPDARPRWLCQCECGNGVVVTSRSLKSKVPSCGCYTKEMKALQASTHGLTNSPLYKVWSDMRERCNNPKDKSYPYYGGRGIKVDPRWEDFETFYNDMIDGYEPGLQLDRIDTDGDYELGNCHWATRTENMRNKRNTIRVDSIYGLLTLGELAEKSGMKHLTLYNRLKKGVPDEFITVKNAVGLRDLKPLFEGAVWMDESREERLNAAIEETKVEVQTRIAHG